MASRDASAGPYHSAQRAVKSTRRPIGGVTPTNLASAAAGGGRLHALVSLEILSV